jgi:hypothetical protein
MHYKYVMVSNGIKIIYKYVMVSNGIKILYKYVMVSNGIIKNIQNQGALQ